MKHTGPLLLTLAGALCGACGESRMRTLPELDEEASLQDPRLEPCEVDTFDGPVQGLCGTLVVAEREGEPEKVLSLPLQRIRGQAPGADALPVVYLGNGPGQSNFSFLPPRELTQGNDFVRLGYRGADSSVTLECDEVARVIRETPALTDAHLDQVRQATNDCLQRLNESGHSLSDFGLDDVARDLHAALDVLDYERVHVLADGFGLEVALAFVERFPGRVERIVATSPAPVGPFLLDAESLQSHLDAIAGRCAASDHCGSDDLLTDIHRAREALPSRWVFTSIDSGRLSLVTALSLLGRESTVRAVDAWAAAGDGSYAGLAMMSWLGDSIGQNLFIWGDALAKTVPLAFDPERNYREENQRTPERPLGAPARLLLYGAAPDSQWLPLPDRRSSPEEAATETGPSPEAGADPEDNRSEVETPTDLPPRTPGPPAALFVHGTVDPTRPGAHAAFAGRLAAIEQVTIEEAVLASEAWALQPNEMARLVADYLNRGEVDGSRLTKLPWTFAPQLRLSTMQWVLTVLTVALPLLLFYFVYLLFRRVKRTIEQERTEQLGAGSDQSSS